MLYLTDFSTASKMLNLNNPIQETVRFRSVGSGITLLLSVPKGRDICECRRKSVICYIRALQITPCKGKTLTPNCITYFRRLLLITPSG